MESGSVARTRTTSSAASSEALLVGGQQRAGDALAELVEALSLVDPQLPGHATHAYSRVAPGRVDQAVGVEDEQAALRHPQLHTRTEARPRPAGDRRRSARNEQCRPGRRQRAAGGPLGHGAALVVGS